MFLQTSTEFNPIFRKDTVELLSRTFGKKHYMKQQKLNIAILYNKSTLIISECTQPYGKLHRYKISTLLKTKHYTQ